MRRELQVFLHASVATISTVITPDQFLSTVKAWREGTSISPSGRHLGHYRTAILDAEVAALHTQLLNLPIQHGFAPERWTYSVTPLIEKDTGRPYLTRLCVIHLFEADYKLFLKIIYGRRMVKNAELSNALNEQQHGSRPRRMTTDALFLVSAYLIIATVLPFTAHSILHLLELTALPPYSAVSIHSMVATVRYKVLNISVHPIYLFWIVLLHLTLIE
jgi:hypothetical protein